MSNTAQQGPAPKPRNQVGWCEYQLDFKGTPCGQPAYYRIDMDCDDMTAEVCNKHHDAVLTMFGLPDEDE